MGFTRFIIHNENRWTIKVGGFPDVHHPKRGSRAVLLSTPFHQYFTAKGLTLSAVTAQSLRKSARAGVAPGMIQFNISLCHQSLGQPSQNDDKWQTYSEIIIIPLLWGNFHHEKTHSQDATSWPSDWNLTGLTHPRPFGLPGRLARPICGTNGSTNPTTMIRTY